MYFNLVGDVFSDIGIVEPDDLPVGLTFTNGRPIDMPVDNPFVFRTNAKAGDKLPDITTGRVPAMSKRMIEIFEGAGVDNLQKFPAIVKSVVDGTVWEDYFAVNILGLVSCVDMAKSKYEEIFPDYYEFEEIAIDASKANEALLFRLEENETVILIHKRVGTYKGQMDPNKEIVGLKVLNEIKQ